MLTLVAAASALAALFLGSFPALHAARADLTRAFRDGARLTASRRETRSLAMLVVGQVAIAFVLVAGVGLAIRGFRALAGSAGIACRPASRRRRP